MLSQVRGCSGRASGRSVAAPAAAPSTGEQPVALTKGSCASWSTVAMLGAVTRPKTVKPPFCASRLALLSARLTNHWLVALFGLPPSLAIATVARTLERVGLNSLTTGGSVGMAEPRGEAASLKRKPPPWMTKPLASRWKKLAS